MCIPKCICVNHVCAWCQQRSEASDPLKLELQLFVSNHVGAGNQTWVPKEQPVFLIAAVFSSHPPPFFFFYINTVSGSSGWPQTQYIAKGDLEFSPASTQVLGF